MRTSTPFRSSRGLPDVADKNAKAVRPLLLSLVLEGHGRKVIAKRLNELRVLSPGGTAWHPLTVRRVLERLGLDDVRKAIRAERVAA